MWDGQTSPQSRAIRDEYKLVWGLNAPCQVGVTENLEKRMGWGAKSFRFGVLTRKSLRLFEGELKVRGVGFKNFVQGAEGL